jgi:NAD-dependent SIR2 family protein deacetylase
MPEMKGTVLEADRGNLCDRCGCTMEVIEDNGTFQVMSCLYCDRWDQIPRSSKPYINHCWKCYSVIDSRRCPKSDLPEMGYHCLKCGEDLRKLKGYGTVWETAHDVINPMFINIKV